MFSCYPLLPSLRIPDPDTHLFDDLNERVFHLPSFRRRYLWRELRFAAFFASRFERV